MFYLVHVHRVYENKRIPSYLREKAHRSWNPVMANYMKIPLHYIKLEFHEGLCEILLIFFLYFVYCKLFMYVYEKLLDNV